MPQRGASVPPCYRDQLIMALQPCAGVVVGKLEIEHVKKAGERRLGTYSVADIVSSSLIRIGWS